VVVALPRLLLPRETSHNRGSPLSARPSPQDVGGTWHDESMRPAAVSPLIIGRETELAMLREALQESVNGGTRTVVLSGEAGIGKSRVIQEFLADLPSGVIPLRSSIVARMQASRSNRSPSGWRRSLDARPTRAERSRAIASIRCIDHPSIRTASRLSSEPCTRP